MAISKPRGRAPVPDDKRRRVNKPVSYGLAEPVVAGEAVGQPELGLGPVEELVTDMWGALKGSVEGQFLSAADWQRARMEMWYIDQVLKGYVPANAANWGRVQAGLSELLVSPADKRRAGIELKRAVSDPDEDAAVSQIAAYHRDLAG